MSGHLPFEGPVVRLNGDGLGTVYVVIEADTLLGPASNPASALGSVSVFADSDEAMVAAIEAPGPNVLMVAATFYPRGSRPGLAELAARYPDRGSEPPDGKPRLDD